MTRWFIVAASLLLAPPLLALDGEPAMHDPPTAAIENGRFYASGTGRGLPISVSDDGWTWRRAGTVMSAVPGGRPGPEIVARGGDNTWALAPTLSHATTGRRRRMPMGFLRRGLVLEPIHTTGSLADSAVRALHPRRTFSESISDAASSTTACRRD